MYTPSKIAAASIAAALHGLEWTVKSGYSLNQLLDRLHNITAIERVSYGSMGFSSKY
jgi:cyclin D2